MADDGEIDIEGDFELKLDTESSVGYDLNELPSKSANLLPEFTNPPWMLEQGWSLDTCLDEKSKATIEKMLQEEQNYLLGRSIPKSPVKIDGRKGSTHKKPWTEEEKQYFIKGLEIYGRSWTKISELIPTRTSLQVKNYAQQYFKQKSKQTETKSPDDNSTDNLTASISTTLASVMTGQPTVQAGIAAKHSRQRGGSLSVDNHDSYSNHRELSPLKFGNFSCLPSFSPSSDSLGIIQNEIGNVLLVRDLPGDIILSPGGSSAPDNSSSPEEEEDIDIENEDAEDNAILQSRSASPSSVYETLLKSANIRQRENAQFTVVNNKTSTESEILTDFAENNVNTATSSEIKLEVIKDETTVILSEEAVIAEAELSQSEFRSNGLVLDTKLNYSSSRMEDVLDAQIETNCSNVITTSNGEVIELPIPQKECVFEKDGITDEERKVHPEFFDGRQSKTPQRYLKIRNYILESWYKCKPEYLNKTSVRPGLKNCGDVNCIGRIHSYLEQCGAINFGCDQTCYNRPTKSASTKEKTVEDKLSLCVKKMEAMRPRKRKIRDSFGFWVDEKDAEGKTIDHSRALVDTMSSSSKSSRMDKYDPFKLIPCCRFEEKMPPFSVEIHSTVLAIVDIHAHISKTEVIGLLGGQYDPVTTRLQMITAVPCVSISTGMQCEMDPVSQTVAAETISNSGLSIVGWYHSHPTFTPNPSVRDLETQLKFQDWFAKGGSNFVGMIVNPYRKNSSPIQSEFRCLTVSDETSDTEQYNIPYQFDFKVAMEMFSSEVVLRTSEDILECHQHNPHSVDLTTTYRYSENLTCLDKMLQSLQSYLPLGTEEVSSLLSCLRDMFGQKLHHEEITVDIRDDTDFYFVPSDVIA